MLFSLCYYAGVKTDVSEAKTWYKTQKEGLDKRFAIEVKNCLNRLHKNPLLYEVKYKNVRTAFTSVFPYAVHFYIDESKQQIVIIAVVHQSRNPAMPYNRNDE